MYIICLISALNFRLYAKKNWIELYTDIDFSRGLFMAIYTWSGIG